MFKRPQRTSEEDAAVRPTKARKVVQAKLLRKPARPRHGGRAKLRLAPGGGLFDAPAVGREEVGHVVCPRRESWRSNEEPSSDEPGLGSCCADSAGASVQVPQR